jgi:phosphoribosylamine--glycine ligase
VLSTTRFKIQVPDPVTRWKVDHAADSGFGSGRLRCGDATMGASLCVVLAAGGYPANYATGNVIRGLDEASAVPQVMVFHAGTSLDRDTVRTSGGRVLSVTAIGETIDEAADRAYEAAAKIDFEGKQLRHDIGWRARTR